MISISSLDRMPEEQQRLLKGIVFSLIFHAVLILILGGVSLIYLNNPSPVMGPVSVFFESFEIPVEEPEPLPFDEPELEPNKPEPAEELPVPDKPEPEDIPEPEPSEEPVYELPESSPGAKPAEADSPSPVETSESSTPAAPAASPAPAQPASRGYEGSTGVSSAYADLFAETRESEAMDGGSSGETQTEPEDKPAWSSEGSGVYSSDTSRTVVDQPVGGKSGSASDSSDSTEGTDGEDLPDLGALDEAIDRITEEDQGVFIVKDTGTEVTVSVPGNEGENTRQISFLDGEGRELLSSEHPVIPDSVKSIGLPQYIITVYFSVTPDGTVEDLKIDPPSGNNELDTAIIQSVRNWGFNSSGENEDVRARVQFLIKVK